MEAKLIEGQGRQPLIRFPDGRTGIPVNLRFWSRHDFLAHIGKRVTVRSQLSEHHYTVLLPGFTDRY